MTDGTRYLAPGVYIDSDNPAVVAFAERATRASHGIDRVIRLYQAVRDDIAYEAYLDFDDPSTYRASAVLQAGKGFCVGKAALLAACARAQGIPARVGYADVRNHMTSRRLYERMKSDVFMWHSYTDLYINNKWVKATPAFDRKLCERVGVQPLAFDGTSDSLFQPYSPSGRRHMEYLRDRGTFTDVPFDLIVADFRRCYAGMQVSGPVQGSFADEVESR
ncbi:MAG: transglutaminase family protein [Hyphomicrobiaceae bacterium]|nr:MAG: transglutaminase family protein [Hyphomicrobiaceae bacterium]